MKYVSVGIKTVKEKKSYEHIRYLSSFLDFGLVLKIFLYGVCVHICPGCVCIKVLFFYFFLTKETLVITLWNVLTDEVVIGISSSAVSLCLLCFCC